ncbi:hypothetical protein CDEST_01533 [Colletotrichum destructivum]|uniref:Uncharacterized protein n=1 Tax=Colletotrichum destructivum TaxID=34406 RepID=A0AAX4HZG2_9PEZI|nr:hypothetical protein CDEST_01533 [Colletotrichum destructivum]
MQIEKLTVLAFSFMLPLVAAAPTEGEQGTVGDLEVVEAVEAGAAKTLKVCMDKDLSGPCKTWSIPDRKCYHIGPDFNDRVSSYEVKGGMYCFLFRDTSCRGGWSSSSGRVNWLSEAWNDKFSSFQCNV